ncbi:MAG: hexokinase [Pelosinus sp.]|nr:hexokinase [Pelosinus sp.]
MSNLESALQKLQTQMTISTEEVLEIAHKFRAELAAGLAGKPSSLKMLPSFVTTPTGKETGEFLALDFGGTNVRVLLAELFAEGRFTVKASIAKPLNDPNGRYDYIYSKASGTQLFDFIAEQIAEIAKPGIKYPLGHTFSFPSQQKSINNAELIHWTKEIDTTGVEGQNVNQLLGEALLRRGVPNVMPEAIINDTVGTLLTAAYINQNTDLGSICGTGHNTAYLEPNAPWNHGPMIINTESGNFDKLDITKYDEQVDKASEQPGAQRLEKMSSGRYVGELIRIIALDLLQHGLLPNCSTTATQALSVPAALSGADVSLLIKDSTDDLTNISTWLEERLHITYSTKSDRLALKQIALLVAERSARLVAATFIGIINHIDENLDRNHNIAIDGTLYEKMPGYAANIEKTMTEVFGAKAGQITTVLSKDGSGIGAAIAVAITSSK